MINDELTSPYPPRPAERSAAADRSYVLLSVVLGVVMLFQQLNQQWSRDVFVHIAAIREFSAHGLAAKNPFTGDNSPDAYLTPFSLLGGWLQAATHWDVTTVLTVLAMMNLALFVVALRMFVRTVSLRPWAPTLALACTLVAWGIGPWRWSGYLNLNSIGFGLPYPSVFATAVGLGAVVALIRFVRGGPAWNAAAAIILGTLALLSHPLTALWLGMIALAFVVDAVREVERWRLLVVGGCAVVAGVLALAWTPYSLLDVLSNSQRWEVGNQGLYHLFFLRAFLALPGVAALWIRARKRKLDPLVTSAILIAATYAMGAVSDSGLLGRTMPGLLLVLHVAFADVLAGLDDRRAIASSDIRHAVVATGVTVLIVGAIGVAGGVLHAVPRAVLPSSLRGARTASVVAPWEQLRRVLDPASVVVAPDALTARVGAFGHVIVPPHQSPSLRPRDFEARNTARDVILADPTSPAAQELRRRYAVTHLVVASVHPQDEGAGRVVLRTKQYVVIDLRAAKTDN